MTSDPNQSAETARLRVALTTMPATGGHLSEEEWVRFATHQMPEGERARVADHIVSCADCASTFRVVSQVSREATSDAIAPGRWARHSWLGLAAALVVVATGASLWLFTPTRSTDNALATNARDTSTPPAPSTPAPAPAPPAAVAPSWAELGSAPEVRLPPSMVLTVRGAAADREAFLAEFGRAVGPYQVGRFAEAATALAPVAARYPHIAEAWFYLGAARLFNGQSGEAVESFRRAFGSEVVGDEARWLEAVALERAGRAADATRALADLCGTPGPNQARSCAATRP